MATPLYLDLTTSATDPRPLWAGDASAMTASTVAAPNAKLVTARGSTVRTINTTTVTGPATVLGGRYISPPLDADVTVSGTIAWNIWALETAMTTNCSVRVEIYRLQPDGTATLIGSASDAVELGTASTLKTGNITPTSTNFKAGDCIGVLIYAVDAGGTMAAGTMQHFVGGATAGASGDSFVSFTETLTFALANGGGTTLRFVDTASDVVSAFDDWLLQLGGTAVINTYATDSVAGPTAPVRATNGAGGTGVRWLTPQLQAVSVPAVIAEWGISSGVSAACNATLLFKLWKTASDGSSPTLLAQYRWNGNTVNTATQMTTGSGTDLLQVPVNAFSLVDGERLMVEFFVDDALTGTIMAFGASTEGTAMSSGQTINLTLNTNATLNLGATLTAYTPSTPRVVNRASIVSRLRSHVGSVVTSWRTIPRTPLVPRWVNRQRVVPAQRERLPRPVTLATPTPPLRFVAPPPPERVVNRARVVDVGQRRLASPAVAQFRTVARPQYFDRVVNRATVVRAGERGRAGAVVTSPLAPPQRFVAPVTDRFVQRGQLVDVAAIRRRGSVTTRQARRAGAQLTVTAYRFYYDDNTPDTSTARAAQSTGITLPVDGGVFQIRWLVENNSDFENTDALAFQHRLNGGTWNLGLGAVTIGVSGFISSFQTPLASRLSGSANIFDGNDSMIREADIGWQARRVDPGEYMELALYLQLHTTPVPGDVIEFRLVKYNTVTGTTIVVPGTSTPLDVTTTAIASITVAAQDRLPSRPRACQLGPGQTTRLGAVAARWRTTPREEPAVAPERVVQRATVVAAGERRRSGAVVTLQLTAPQRTVAPVVERIVNRITVVAAQRSSPPAQVAMSWRTAPRPQYFDRVARALVVGAAAAGIPRAIQSRWRTVPRPPDRRTRPLVVVAVGRQVSDRNIVRVPTPANRFVAAPAERVKQRFFVAIAVGERRAAAVTTRWRTIPRQPLVPRVVPRARIVEPTGKRLSSVLASGLMPARRFVAPILPRRVPHQLVVGTALLARTAALWLVWRGRTRINPPGPANGSASVGTVRSRARVHAPHHATTETRSRARSGTTSGAGRTAMISGTGHTEAEQL